MSFALFGGVESAAYTVITHIASALSPVGGVAAAIVVCTFALRLAMLPLTLRAVRGERARARLAPRVAALRRKHANRPDRLAEELGPLYRAEGVSPMAGLGPLLLQAPVFLVLGRLFYTSRVAGQGNALLGAQLFGAPLGARFITHPSPAFGLLVVLIGLAAWSCWRARQIQRTQPEPATGAVAWIARVAPFTTVLTALFVPLAAALYLVATTAWTGVESTVLRRGLP